MSSIWQLSWTLVVSFVGKTGFAPASPWLLTRPLKKKTISVLPVISEPPIGIEPISPVYDAGIISLYTKRALWERRGSNPLTLNQYVTIKGNGFTDRRRYSPITCTPNRIRTGISTLRGWPPQPVSKIGAYFNELVLGDGIEPTSDAWKAPRLNH